MGNIIPFDGVVVKGDSLVNQASMTGESIPVRKEEGSCIFAGTVVEEGEITIRVTAVSGSGRYDKIVRMIEESEKLKSGLESKAEGLADSEKDRGACGCGRIPCGSASRGKVRLCGVEKRKQEVR